MTFWASSPSGFGLALVQVSRTALHPAMLEQVGRQSVQLLVVQLLNRRPYALICYDLFLYECDEQARNNINKDVYLPVYVIVKRGNVYHVRRDKKSDATVAIQYVDFQNFDKGPLPYFSDYKNPPLYDGGV